MEKIYQRKAVLSFGGLALLGLAIIPFSFGLGVFTALIGAVISLKFLAFSASENLSITDSGERVIPKLKEIDNVKVFHSSGTSKILEAEELEKFKKYLKSIKSVNSTETPSKKHKIRVTDIYEGEWDVSLHEINTAKYEFVVNQRYYGGGKSVELGKILTGNA